METNIYVAHGAYKQGQVTAAAPVRIVVLLYEGAIRFARQAQQNFDDPAIRGVALGRTHRIVSELLASLDRERGGEIAGNLDGLYRYVLDAITQANLDLDKASINSVVNVLQTLVSAWKQIENRREPRALSCSRSEPVAEIRTVSISDSRVPLDLPQPGMENAHVLDRQRYHSGFGLR